MGLERGPRNELCVMQKNPTRIIRGRRPKAGGVHEKLGLEGLGFSLRVKQIPHANAAI